VAFPTAAREAGGASQVGGNGFVVATALFAGSDHAEKASRIQKSDVQRKSAVVRWRFDSPLLYIKQGSRQP
jgi:hypothetical protein